MSLCLCAFLYISVCVPLCLCVCVCVCLCVCVCVWGGGRGRQWKHFCFSKNKNGRETAAMAVIAKWQKGKCVLSVVCYDCSLKKNPADRADLQSLVVRCWHLSCVSAWVAVSCFSCCFVVSWLVLSFVGLSILNKLRFINMFYVFGWKTSCKKKKKKKKKNLHVPFLVHVLE